MRIRGRHFQGGFSLIELSVAAAIYTMGLGSVSLMMMLAVQGTAGARQDTAAAMHAASLAERIAMSSDAFGHYVFPAGPTPCDGVPDCAGGDGADITLSDWQAQLAADLPSGAGLVCRDGTPSDGTPGEPACDGTGGPVIKIFWTSPGEDGAPVDWRRHVSRLPLP